MQAVLLDIDGVLLEQGHAINGAADALTFLQQRNIPFRCITNTISVSATDMAERCRMAGLHPVTAAHILNPVSTAVRWLKEQNISQVELLVPEGCRDLLAGFTGAPDYPQAVVVGDVAEGFSFAAMNRLFRLLMADPQIPLIALGMTRYFTAADGLQLDAGPFIRALEYATGRSALVMGKPGALIFEQALEEMGVSAAQAVMVGDDRQTDVLAAQQLGMTGILVRTGKYRPGDEGPDQSGDAPQYVLNSVADLPDWLGA